MRSAFFLSCRKFTRDIFNNIQLKQQIFAATFNFNHCEFLPMEEGNLHHLKILYNPCITISASCSKSFLATHCPNVSLDARKVIAVIHRMPNNSKWTAGLTSIVEMFRKFNRSRVTLLSLISVNKLQVTDVSFFFFN